MPTLKARCDSLKRVQASLIFIDPPYGWNVVKAWDKVSDIWGSEYWEQVLRSLDGIIAEGTCLCVFGDVFNVLPPLTLAISKYNDKKSRLSKGLWTKPTQMAFNKTNHSHKTNCVYSQSIENAFLFWYKKMPKISKLPFELGGNMLFGPKVAGKRVLLNAEGNIINPCQKSALWLKVLVENHAKSNTIVLDLTAGSMASYFACYFAPVSLHWVGSDIDPTMIANWNFLRKGIRNEEAWFQDFVLGK